MTVEVTNTTVGEIHPATISVSLVCHCSELLLLLQWLGVYQFMFVCIPQDHSLSLGLCVLKINFIPSKSSGVLN